MNFDDLAALTLHDVKNRLAILASRAEAKGDHETVHDALEAAAALSRLLVYYKAEKGQLTLDIEARVPADLLEELAAEIGQQTALTVTSELNGAPALFFYDESLVRMILLNALYNARRHARQQIVIAVHQTPDGWLMFEVRDDGPGYPPRVLEQPLAMQAISHEGTGLGLHLASRVAALHQHAGQAGTIELKNDGGAVFSLHLPQ
jgi:signal transduction histidine kinase